MKALANKILELSNESLRLMEQLKNQGCDVEPGLLSEDGFYIKVTYDNKSQYVWPDTESAESLLRQTLESVIQWGDPRIRKSIVNRDALYFLMDTDHTMCTLIDHMYYYLKTKANKTQLSASLQNKLKEWIEENSLDGDPHNFIDFAKINDDENE